MTEGFTIVIVRQWVSLANKKTLTNKLHHTYLAFLPPTPATLTFNHKHEHSLILYKFQKILCTFSKTFSNIEKAYDVEATENVNNKMSKKTTTENNCLQKSVPGEASITIKGLALKDHRYHLHYSVLFKIHLYQQLFC